MLTGMPTKEPTGLHKAFAKALLAGMKREGIKPKDVSLELGVDPEAVRLWMRGDRMPRDKTLKRLAKMIDVDVSVLRYGEAGKPTVLPRMQGMHLTDEDEVRLIEAYRGLEKEWAKQALRRRAVELLEEFGKAGVKNPWAAKAGTQ